MKMALTVQVKANPPKWNWAQLKSQYRWELPRTFLHTNATLGLCTAYFVITSRMREYSSEALRSAESRVGVLKNRSSIWR